MDEYSNHMAAKDSDIASLTKTKANLQGDLRNLRGNNESPLKKSTYHPSIKKAYTHTNRWSASYCWTHGFINY